MIVILYCVLQVCTKLGLCTSVGASPQCVLCEFVMTQIDQILADNSTEVSTLSICPVSEGASVVQW